MNIGVSAFAWTTRLTSRHLALLPSLREHGLSGFEVAMFEPSDLPVSEIRHTMRANGLEASVCAILPAGVNPISPDKLVREKSVVHLGRCIEAAAAMGAGLICGPIYAPIGYLPGRRRNDEEWNWAIECLHPRIGVTIDTFHANIEEKSIAEAVSLLGGHLKHLHASENDRGLLGSGHVDFLRIVQSLKSIGYQGSLMIEGFGYSADEPDSLGALWGDLSVTPEDIAFRGADYLRSLLE